MGVSVYGSGVIILATPCWIAITTVSDGTREQSTAGYLLLVTAQQCTLLQGTGFMQAARMAIAGGCEQACKGVTVWCRHQ